jgi:putative tryptophan/tyrosine transport system substrate-binding protein
VASLSHPGGNLTGLTQYTAAIEAKRLELLREFLPTAARIAMLVNPTNPNLSKQLTDLPVAARSIGLQLTTLEAATEADIDAIFCF